MIKILIDEDMPLPTVGLLKSFHIDAFDVRNIGLKGAADDYIFKYAQKKGLIILSRDKGFSNLVKYPLGSHCGIIVIRFPYDFIRNQVLLGIKNFFSIVEKGKLSNNLTIVEVGKYRIKKRVGYY